MTLTDPRTVSFISTIPIDKIIGTFEGSFNSPAPTSGGGVTNTTSSFSTSISESTFFQGIFSVDGGTTWNDFNTQVSSQIVVSGRSNAGTFAVKADNYYDYSGGGGTAYTVMYKVALIAKYGQGIIDPQPVASSTLFNSNFNYQKILSDTSQAVSVPNLSNASSTFSHSLGYIPKVRSFIETTSTFTGLVAGMYETTFYLRQTFSAGPSSSGVVEATSGVCIDTSNVYVDMNNQGGGGSFSGTLFMRIYYDD